MPKVLSVILLIILSFFFSSCKLSSTPQATVARSTPSGEVRSQTSIPGKVPFTPTDTSAPPTPSDTPVPPTPTQPPTRTGLNATGPYVIFEAHNGLWITNPDGSFPTRLSDFEITSALDLHQNISPTGERMAVVVSNDQGLDLVLIKIPSGEAETITHLIDRPTPDAYDPTSPNSFATYAIRDYDSIAWQPGDGRLLAFIGAIDGTTADLYLYDTQTKQITQLTDGPSQAVLPVWSPDGQYILHFGVSWVPPFGGAIGGANQLDGVWAVQASDGKVITLPKPEGSLPHFVGWQDDSHYLTYGAGECGSQNLFSVDIVSGESAPVVGASFTDEIAMSPENGAFLFYSEGGCMGSQSEGVFLLSVGENTPIQLLEKRAWEIYWLPESKVFDAYPEALLSSNGQTRYAPPVYESSYEPAVSKEGYQAWEVIQNQNGRVVVRVPGGEWQSILNGSVDELIWDPVDGKTLLVALDDGSLYAASYPEFAPRLIGSLGVGVNQVIWSP